MAEITKLADGFAYCQIMNIYDSDFHKKPMVDKNGSPMICIKWSVVDCKGDTGFIRTYISSKVKTVISNIENALGINDHIFDERNRKFNTSILMNRCCAAVLKFDDRYGSKIERYVPIEFFNYLNGKAPEEDKRENKNDSFKRTSTYTGVKGSDAKRLIEEKGGSFDNDGTLSFDDIPF